MSQTLSNSCEQHTLYVASVLLVPMRGAISCTAVLQEG